MRNGGLVVWGVHGVRFVGVGFRGFGDVSRELWGVGLLHGGAVSQILGLFSRSLMHSVAWQIWTSASHDCQGSCICTMPNKDKDNETVVVNAECPVTGHSREVNCVAFSDDGAQAISGSDDGTVRGYGTREGPGGMCASVPGMAEQG